MDFDEREPLLPHHRCHRMGPAVAIIIDDGDDDDEEMPDLSELQDKWRKTRNQEYRAAMRKEQLRKKLDNKRKLLENKARFEEKQKQKDNTEE